jgi:hypothetical protein
MNGPGGIGGSPLVQGASPVLGASPLGTATPEDRDTVAKSARTLVTALHSTSASSRSVTPAAAGTPSSQPPSPLPPATPGEVTIDDLPPLPAAAVVEEGLPSAGTGGAAPFRTEIYGSGDLAIAFGPSSFRPVDGDAPEGVNDEDGTPAATGKKGVGDMDTGFIRDTIQTSTFLTRPEKQELLTALRVLKERSQLDRQLRGVEDKDNPNPITHDMERADAAKLHEILGRALGNVLTNATRPEVAIPYYKPAYEEMLKMMQNPDVKAFFSGLTSETLPKSYHELMSRIYSIKNLSSENSYRMMEFLTGQMYQPENIRERILGAGVGTEGSPEYLINQSLKMLREQSLAALAANAAD